MDVEGHATVFVPYAVSPTIFTSVRSNWFRQYAVLKHCRTEDCYIAEIDSHLTEITLPGSLLTTAWPSNCSGSDKVYEEHRSPALFSPYKMSHLLCGYI